MCYTNAVIDAANANESLDTNNFEFDVSSGGRDDLRFAILGAGAIGSVYGGYLSRAGHEVTLLARGEQYDALSSRGLRVLTSKGHFSCKPRVVESPTELPESDVAIVAVKGRDTSPLLQQCSHLIRGKVTFFSLQNGGGKDDVLTSLVGREKMIGAVTFNGATLIEPGVVEHTAAAHTWLGEFPRGTSERCRSIALAIQAAGLETVVVEDIMSVKWAKLVHFAASAGVSALTRLPLYLIFKTPETSRLVLTMMKEGAEVMRAHGITVEDYPNLPIKTYSTIPIEEAVSLLEKRGQTMEEKGLTRMKLSTLQDVLRERKTEADSIIGYVLEKGKAKGVETPTLRTIFSLIAGLEKSFNA